VFICVRHQFYSIDELLPSDSMLLARSRLGLRSVSRLKTPRCQVQVRSFSSSSASSASSSSSVAKSPFSVFGGLTNELDKLSPRIEVQPDQIEILKSPEQFYESLKVGASGATNHWLSSIDKDSQGEKADISFYSIHWQDGTRIGRSLRIRVKLG
jgi:hypothetical protein